MISCIADGQHRITARQELGLPECPFYLVPLSQERMFRVEGLDAIEQELEKLKKKQEGES
jgi:ParB-like chromosome segregation protein Spo0J